MNVLYLSPTVMNTRTAQTLMVHSFALVTVVILVMELFAKVSELVVPFEVMHNIEISA